VRLGGQGRGVSPRVHPRAAAGDGVPKVHSANAAKAQQGFGFHSTSSPAAPTPGGPLPVTPLPRPPHHQPSLPCPCPCPCPQPLPLPLLPPLPLPHFPQCHPPLPYSALAGPPSEPWYTAGTPHRCLRPLAAAWAGAPMPPPRWGLRQVTPLAFPGTPATVPGTPAAIPGTPAAVPVSSVSRGLFAQY